MTDKKKYERLTKKDEDWFDSPLENMEVYDRLAEIEDKIENGTLVELPCKVGSKVYEVVKTPNYNFISEEVIGDIWIKEDGVFARTGLYTTDYFEFKEFGKTVFLTKAEAETKLKELQND